MFQELMPLLSQRVLILTLSRVSDEEVCVNVIPKPLKSNLQNDDMAHHTVGRHWYAPRAGRTTAKATGGVCGDSSGAVFNPEERERTDGRRRQGSEGSCQEINEQTVPQRLQQKRCYLLGAVKTQTDAQGNSDDSHSSPATQAIGAGSSSVDLGASTGSLFDIETKNDN